MNRLDFIWPSAVWHGYYVHIISFDHANNEARIFIPMPLQKNPFKRIRNVPLDEITVDKYHYL